MYGNISLHSRQFSLLEQSIHLTFIDVSPARDLLWMLEQLVCGHRAFEQPEQRYDNLQDEHILTASRGFLLHLSQSLGFMYGELSPS